MDFKAARLGGSNRLGHNAALVVRQFVRLSGLVAQTRIELPVGHEAGRGPDPQIAPTPEFPVEQPHGSRPGVDGRLAAADPVRRGRHDVG